MQRLRMFSLKHSQPRRPLSFEPVVGLAVLAGAILVGGIVALWIFVGDKNTDSPPPPETSSRPPPTTPIPVMPWETPRPLLDTQTLAYGVGLTFIKRSLLSKGTTDGSVVNADQKTALLLSLNLQSVEARDLLLTAPVPYNTEPAFDTRAALTPTQRVEITAALAAELSTTTARVRDVFAPARRAQDAGPVTANRRAVELMEFYVMMSEQEFVGKNTDLVAAERAISLRIESVVPGVFVVTQILSNAHINYQYLTSATDTPPSFPPTIITRTTPPPPLRGRDALMEQSCVQRQGAATGARRVMHTSLYSCPERGRAASVVDVMVYKPEGGARCSGVLIAEQWVLTAAHCLNLFGANDPVNVKGWVEVGCTHRSDSRCDVYDIDKIFGHCSIDLLLLKLSSPVKQTKLSPNSPVAWVNGINIKVPVPGPSDNREWSLYGWGLDDLETQHKTTALDAKLVSGYGKSPAYTYWVNAYSSAFSANVCSGDSGGPIFHNGVVWGVLSFSTAWKIQGEEFCLSQRMDSFYVRTDVYAPWILKTMREEKRPSDGC